jgi:UDP-N-acetylmuramoylalanine--D-glutamate ligase
MKSVFLGVGKVNRAIAKHIAGEKVFLNEADGINFDSLAWSTYLPADVFISPGVDPRRNFFKEVQSYEVRELDRFRERFAGTIIAITGTDGKSTLTTQLGEVFRRALPKKKIFVGGNLGTAMFDAFDDTYDIAILEISSFQAERLKSEKKINYAILINLAPDHLDRYKDLSEYYAAKWHLLSHAEKIFFPSNIESPLKKRKSAAQYKNEDSLSLILRSIVESLAPDFQFVVDESLFENLPRLPHRLDPWVEKTGRRVFINDSKATTVHASLYALKVLQGKCSSLSLIVGGKPKGESFRPLVKGLRESDRLLIVGEARNLILQQTGDFTGSRSVYLSLSDLLNSVLAELPPDSSLLLSPACSSYDEFENFEERGNFFLEKIREKFEIESVELTHLPL